MIKSFANSFGRGCGCVLGISLGLLILLAVVIALSSTSPSDTETTAGTSAATETPTPQRITAQALADDFDENQVAAEAKWRGKLVEFESRISNITDSGLSFHDVASKAFSLTQIACRIKDKSQLLSLKNGQSVTVRGVVGEQTIGVIEVKSCVVVE